MQGFVDALLMVFEWLMLAYGVVGGTNLGIIE